MNNISIIVPFYNGNKYVQNLFDMIHRNVTVLLNNDIKAKIQLLLINDSPEIEIHIPENTYPAEFSYNTINHKSNCGIHAARVTGLNHISSEYVIFLDQDDEINDCTLYSQLSKIESYDMIVSNAYIENERHEKKPLYSKESDVKKMLNKSSYIKSYNQIISPGQCLIKTRAIPKEWKQNIMKVNGSDDLFLWILMYNLGMKIKFNNDILYTHKFTGANLSSSLKKMYDSTKEVAFFLKDIEYIPNKTAPMLLRSHCIKINMSDMNAVQKIIYVLRNIDIMSFRLLWRTRKIFSKKLA